MPFSSSDAFGFDARDTGLDTMSARAYIGIIAFFIAAGLGVAAWLASLTYHMQPTWLWIVGYFVVAIPGIIISARSNNWVMSLLGYGMVVCATGSIIGPYVALYALPSVFQILLLTIGVTATIGFFGAIYPKSVEHWGGFFLMALLVIIFGDVARMFMVSAGFAPVAMGIWDWIAAVVFCGLIFFDMNRAMRMDYTLDNAVDTAVALYLDIINLFLRLLSAKGRKSDD